MRRLPTLPLYQRITQRKHQLPYPVRGLRTRQYPRQHPISLLIYLLSPRRPCRFLSQLCCRHRNPVSFRACTPRQCQRISLLGAQPQRLCRPSCQVLCQLSPHDQVQFQYLNLRVYQAQCLFLPRLLRQRFYQLHHPDPPHFQRCYRLRFLKVTMV